MGSVKAGQVTLVEAAPLSGLSYRQAQPIGAR